MLNFYYKNHKNFFLLLKTAYQKKQKFFIYTSKNKSLQIILKKLQEKSLILGYAQTKNFQLHIFLRYDRQSLPAINNIFLFPKGRYISLKKLKSFTNAAPFSFSLLHTTFGILETKECEKKNCGGEFIVTIN
jgi:ribosomal protein S8